MGSWLSKALLFSAHCGVVFVCTAALNFLIYGTIAAHPCAEDTTGEFWRQRNTSSNCFFSKITPWGNVAFNFRMPLHCFTDSFLFCFGAWVLFAAEVISPIPCFFCYCSRLFAGWCFSMFAAYKGYSSRLQHLKTRCMWGWLDSVFRLWGESLHTCQRGMTLEDSLCAVEIELGL